jgi:hypothetical protein
MKRPRDDVSSGSESGIFLHACNKPIYMGSKNTGTISTLKIQRGQRLVGMIDFTFEGEFLDNSCFHSPNFDGNIRFETPWEALKYIVVKIDTCAAKGIRTHIYNWTFLSRILAVCKFESLEINQFSNINCEGDLTSIQSSIPEKSEMWRLAIRGKLDDPNPAFNLLGCEFKYVKSLVLTIEDTNVVDLKTYKIYYDYFSRLQCFFPNLKSLALSLCNLELGFEYVKILLEQAIHMYRFEDLHLEFSSVCDKSHIQYVVNSIIANSVFWNGKSLVLYADKCKDLFTPLIKPLFTDVILKDLNVRYPETNDEFQKLGEYPSNLKSPRRRLTITSVCTPDDRIGTRIPQWFLSKLRTKIVCLPTCRMSDAYVECLVRNDQIIQLETPTEMRCDHVWMYFTPNKILRHWLSAVSAIHLISIRLLRKSMLDIFPKEILLIISAFLLDTYSDPVWSNPITDWRGDKITRREKSVSCSNCRTKRVHYI